MNTFILDGYVEKVKLSDNKKWGMLTLKVNKYYFTIFAFEGYIPLIATLSVGQRVTAIGKLQLMKGKQGFYQVSLSLTYLIEQENKDKIPASDECPF